MLKKFESVNTKLENRITITGSYAMGFPTKFYQENRVFEYKYAVFFYDDITLEIGINLTCDESEKHKYVIRHDKLGKGGGVAIKSLLKTMNIDPMKYKGKYQWEKRVLNEVGDVYVIKLNQNKERHE